MRRRGSASTLSVNHLINSLCPSRSLSLCPGLLSNFFLCPLIYPIPLWHAHTLEFKCIQPSRGCKGGQESKWLLSDAFRRIKLDFNCTFLWQTNTGFFKAAVFRDLICKFSWNFLFGGCGVILWVVLDCAHYLIAELFCVIFIRDTQFWGLVSGLIWDYLMAMYQMQKHNQVWPYWQITWIRIFHHHRFLALISFFIKCNGIACFFPFTSGWTVVFGVRGGRRVH